MSEDGGWAALRERRIAEPGAAEAYDAARLAFELGRSVRELREHRGWSQTQPAKASGMTQSAIARFEAGGTVPTLAVLERLAAALDMTLKVDFEPHGETANWRDVKTKVRTIDPTWDSDDRVARRQQMRERMLAAEIRQQPGPAEAQ